jgi:AcrR family transcriptional regulator
LGKMVYRKTPAAAVRKEARRKLILDAATRLFGNSGYHAATVPMIAAEAHSSIGSFYAHFRNKEDVFAAVLETLGEKVSELIRQARATQPDPLPGIRRAVESIFLYLAQNPLEARILIVESSGLTPRLEQVRRGLIREHAGLVCQMLELVAASFSLDRPAIAARCLVGSVFESLYNWLEQSPTDRPPAEKVARAVADYNSRAIRC